MSQENVEVVRRALDAFNQRDLDAITRDIDADIEVDWSRSPGVEAGIYLGPAATRRFWNTFLEMFDRVVVVPEEFIEHADHVIVPNRARFLGRDGIEVEAWYVAVVTLRDERIVVWRLFRTRAEALKAVGLEE
jgi:ketosteroid isomerase-like protein